MTLPPAASTKIPVQSKPQQCRIQAGLAGIISLGALALISFGGCAELNDPYYGNRYPSNSRHDPYGSDYGRYDDDRYDRERDRDRRRHERERERMEEERERLERERQRLRDEEQRRRFDDLRRPNQPPPQRESCPSGFHETDRKCSDSERKHGCKDIKMPGGTRCINR